MQWIEVTIKTAPGAIDLVCDRLTVLGFDSFIVDDQDQFHEFLEENRQYWDNIVRKATMQEVLEGTAPDFDAIDRLCGEERMGRSAATRKIGF